MSDLMRLGRRVQYADQLQGRAVADSAAPATLFAAVSIVMVAPV